MTKKIDPKLIPCIFEGEEGGDWVDYGSTRVRLPSYKVCARCEDESIDTTDELWDKIEKADVCDTTCPGYEPAAVKTCSRHDEEFLAVEGCMLCMEEDFKESVAVAERDEKALREEEKKWRELKMVSRRRFRIRGFIFLAELLLLALGYFKYLPWGVVLSLCIACNLLLFLMPTRNIRKS